MADGIGNENTGNKPSLSPPSDSSDAEEGASGADSTMEQLWKKFSSALGLGHYIDETEPPPPRILTDITLEGVAEYIRSGKGKKIIVMAGAGISTSAGIPDFRSPGSGLYDNLEKYNLPYPQAIFEISYFIENPKPFFVLARELFPGTFRPTPSHYFVRLLHEKGVLLRLYTQNIDTLERIAGIPEDKIVEAHGSFFTSHCIGSFCGKEYDLDWMKKQIFDDVVPTCTDCNSVVKPDIVFFGENLPGRFFKLASQDFHNCDTLIVIGTSLVVQPFASLVDKVPRWCPRLLINKEKAGETDPMMMMFGYGGGMMFDAPTNQRDVAWLGLCDEGCQTLADMLGWGDDLRKIVQEEHETIDKLGEAGALT